VRPAPNRAPSCLEDLVPAHGVGFKHMHVLHPQKRQPLICISRRKQDLNQWHPVQAAQALVPRAV
jgi:hypothetical protein